MVPVLAAAAVPADAVPSVFAGTANTVAVIVLLLEFLMLRSALLRAQVRLYAAQSAAISVVAVVIAAGGHLPELYALAGLSFVLKVVIVPTVVLRLMRDSSAEISGSGALGVASEVILSILVAAFGFFVVGSLHIGSAVLPSAALSLSVAVVLVAFMLMIVRRDVVSQAVGFFSLENGVSLASLVVAAGLPLILEVAFLFDLLVAVVVFGVIMRTHHGRTRSLSTVDLTRLRG
jgi:hydrogenase-4 component E